MKEKFDETTDHCCIHRLSESQISMSWSNLIYKQARLSLALERAHATTPIHALVRFISSQARATSRLFRLGPSKYHKLVQCELDCAAEGLIFSSRAEKKNQLWELPDSFLEGSAKDFPAHALIDPGFLKELVGDPLNSLDTARCLLIEDGIQGRWDGVPKFAPGGIRDSGQTRIAICLHLFYPKIWPVIRAALKRIPEKWHLYISVPRFTCTKTLKSIADEFPETQFLVVSNRGRDVLPLLRWLQIGIFKKYDFVCKLHTKCSPHIEGGGAWLSEILYSLLGNSDRITTILNRMRNSSEIGIIGPRQQLLSNGHPLHRGTNHRQLKALAERASLPATTLTSPFFAGTMFWFRPAALESLLKLGLDEHDFPIEMGQSDGTPAHAIERLIWPLAERHGFRIEVAEE